MMEPSEQMRDVTYLCSSVSCSTLPIFSASCWRLFLYVVYCCCRSAYAVSQEDLEGGSQEPCCFSALTDDCAINIAAPLMTTARVGRSERKLLSKAHRKSKNVITKSWRQGGSPAVNLRVIPRRKLIIRTRPIHQYILEPLHTHNASSFAH